MALVPDAAAKGLWRDATRQAGAHAVLVGVSDYPHLAGGKGPAAPNNGGLGQLEVSAKTGAAVFTWLQARGEIAGAPLASCRILLAPREGEIADVQAATGGHYGPADFESVRKAIIDWGNDIFAGATAAGPNVAVFMFSGHGVEHLASPAMLCSDILDPRVPGGARKAVAFTRLCQAIKTYGIDRALLLIDACRDVPNVARLLNIVGEEVLAPYDDPPRIHDALLCLQSTKTRGSAYQVPGDPATIFGRAVIDALDGTPPSYKPYDTSVAPWRLVFKELEGHVKQRVRDLLKERTATLVQTVVPYGDPYDGDMLVATKQALSADVPQGTVQGIPGQPEPESPESSPFELAPPTLDRVIADRSATVLAGFAPPVDLRVHSDRGALTQFAPMHAVFQHEGITDPWIRSLKIVDRDSEAPVPDAVVPMRARSQEVAGSVTAWLDVLVQPEQGSALWIAAGGEGGPGFAVVVPRDLYGPMPVRLDIGFVAGTAGRWTMTGMSARLHDATGFPGVRDLWRELWEVQRVETLADLARAGELAARFDVLVKALSGEPRAPIAAAIAAGVLLRAGALDRLPDDWMRNLANAFPGLPDGPVLWAETLLRRAQRAVKGGAGKPMRRDDEAVVRRLARDPAYAEAATWFAELAKRGAPVLAAGIAFAVQQERFFRRVVELRAAEGALHGKLAEACNVVQRAASFTVAEGTFASFTSDAGTMAPHEALGRRCQP